MCVVCSFSVVVIVAVIVVDDDDYDDDGDDDVSLWGCQHFWQGFILILVKGENNIF